MLKLYICRREREKSIDYFISVATDSDSSKIIFIHSMLHEMTLYWVVHIKMMKTKNNFISLCKRQYKLI